MTKSSNSPVALTHYMPFEAGLIALESKQISWVCPTVIKDPYLCTADTGLNFSEQELVDESLRLIAKMIFARNPPPNEMANPVIKAIIRWRLEDRFHNDEEVYESLRSMVTDLVRPQYRYAQNLVRTWQSYLSSVRILELSDTIDNTELWRYKADNHRGIAVRFRCESETGHECMAESPIPLRYDSVRLPITSVVEQGQLIFGSVVKMDLPTDEARLLRRPKYDARKKEWVALRMLDEQRHRDELTKQDYCCPFQSEDVVSVFLGAGLSDAEKRKVKSLVKRQYKEIRLFDGSVHESNFDIAFKQVQF